MSDRWQRGRWRGSKTRGGEGRLEVEQSAEASDCCWLAEMALFPRPQKSKIGDSSGWAPCQICKLACARA